MTGKSVLFEVIVVKNITRRIKCLGLEKKISIYLCVCIHIIRAIITHSTIFVCNTKYSATVSVPQRCLDTSLYLGFMLTLKSRSLNRLISNFCCPAMVCALFQKKKKKKKANLMVHIWLESCRLAILACRL